MPADGPSLRPEQKDVAWIICNTMVAGDGHCHQSPTIVQQRRQGTPPAFAEAKPRRPEFVMDVPAKRAQVIGKCGHDLLHGHPGKFAHVVREVFGYGLPPHCPATVASITRGTSVENG